MNFDLLAEILYDARVVDSVDEDDPYESYTKYLETKLYGPRDQFGEKLKKGYDALLDEESNI